MVLRREITDLREHTDRQERVSAGQYRLDPYGIPQVGFSRFARDLVDLVCQLPIRCVDSVVVRARQSNRYALRRFSLSA